MPRPRPRRPASCLALAVVLSLAARPATAQDAPAKKVDVSLVFLTESNIASLAVDADPLVGWVKPMIGALEAQFAGEESPAYRSMAPGDRPKEVTPR
jgi:hypothetical protein